MESEAPRRLHPASLLFDVWQDTRWILLPAVGLVIFGGVGAMSFGVAFFVAAAALARAFFRFATFSYALEPAELVIREGIFEKTERHIPVARIQDLRTEQGVLHRLLGVAAVHVETAGGGGPEASLVVIALDEVARLRASLDTLGAATSADREVPEVSGAAVVAPAASTQVVLRRVGVRELVVEGLTGNALGAGLAVLGGAWAFADDILPGDAYERIASSLLGLARRAGEQEIATTIALGIAALVLFALLSAVGAAVWSVVKFYGFTLSRTGDSLQLVYGLLTRRSSSLPRRRIQVVEIRQGALRRLFGLATIRVETAGGAAGDESGNEKESDVLLPILPREDAAALLPLVLPDFETAEPRWRRVSSKAVGRGARKGALVAVLAAVALYAALESRAALWPLLLVPFAYGVSLLEYRAYGYALEGRFLYVRSGWLGRSAHVVPVRNVQSVVVRRTPFDRRLGLGTLVVDTAGQTFGGRWCSIRNLPADELRRLADVLAHEASRLRADVNRRSRPSAATRS